MRHSLASATFIPPTTQNDRGGWRGPPIEPKRLDAGEGRFRAFVESSVDPILVADGQKNIVFWNKAAEATFGYVGDQMLGQPLTLLLADERADPVGWTRPAASVETRVLGETLARTGRRRNGTEFPVELSISMWEEHGETFYGGIFHDMSGRRRADRDLGEAESKYRALVEGIQLGVYIIQDDRYVYVNPRMTEIFVVAKNYFDMARGVRV